MNAPVSSARALYARETPGFAERVAHATAMLQSAASEHVGRIVQASSLGAEDMVITDLIARHRLGIAVATLDTGRLHAQTLELIDRAQQHYGLTIERYSPPPQEAYAFVKLHGPDAMFRSIELRKACCALRKLEPLKHLLHGRNAWVTGLRREQSDARGEVPFAETASDGRVKLNPLADWSWADVWHYIALHDVPTNPLHDAFMPSIGCEPCTRAIAVGEDFRAGRWWWEQSSKECGLHVHALPQAVDAATGTSKKIAQGTPT